MYIYWFMYIYIYINICIYLCSIVYVEGGDLRWVSPLFLSWLRQSICSLVHSSDSYCSPIMAKIGTRFWTGSSTQTGGFLQCSHGTGEQELGSVVAPQVTCPLCHVPLVQVYTCKKTVRSIRVRFYSPTAINYILGGFFFLLQLCLHED